MNQMLEPDGLSIRVFPTVTDDFVHINITNEVYSFYTDVYSVNGGYMGAQIGGLISLVDMPNGIYILKIYLGGEMKEFKVIKI